MKVGVKTCIIDPADPLPVSYQTLIDKKVHRVALTCWERIKHAFLCFFHAHYRKTYQDAKQYILCRETQPHWIPLKAPMPSTILTDNVLRPKNLKTWLNRLVDTSELQYEISDRDDAPRRWDDDIIFVFGKFHPLEGITEDLLDCFNDHGWSDEMGFLSNDYVSPITVENVTYPTVEHYFQAIKFQGQDDIHQAIIEAETPHQVRKIATKHYSRGSHRDVQEMARRMKIGLWAKFVDANGSPNELGKKLLKTGDQLLIKGNHRAEGYSDKRWGMEFNFEQWPEITLKGQNLLGRLLMELRSYLRSGSFIA